MKAMSQTMYLVVTAIVILVTAVVVLTIFLGGVGPVMNLASAASLCQTEYAAACTAFGQDPPTWNVQNKDVKVGDTTQKISCKQVLERDGKSCKCTNKVAECS